MIEFNHEAKNIHGILGYETKDAFQEAFCAEKGFNDLIIALPLLDFLTTREATPLIFLLFIIYPDANLETPSRIAEYLLPVLLEAEEKKIQNFLNVLIETKKSSGDSLQDLMAMLCSMTPDD